MFTVQNLFIAVWVIGGILSVIGNFRKGIIWVVPTLVLTLFMLFGFWYDSQGDSHFAPITMLVILSVSLLDDVVYFALGRMPAGLFTRPEPAEPIKELIRRFLSFAVTLGLIFLISSYLM